MITDEQIDIKRAAIVYSMEQMGHDELVEIIKYGFTGVEYMDATEVIKEFRDRGL